MSLRVTRHTEEPAELTRERVVALRNLAGRYRDRARRPRDIGDRLNRDQLLELAEGAEELATTIEAPAACAGAT